MLTRAERFIGTFSQLWPMSGEPQYIAAGQRLIGLGWLQPAGGSCYGPAMNTSPLVTSPISLTIVLGEGASRVCFATTDARIAVKIGVGNADEYARWEYLTEGGTVNERAGVRIPRMALLDGALWDWHPDSDRDEYSAAAFGTGRESFRPVLAVERVPQGRRLCDVECHCRGCDGRSVCLNGCVRRQSQLAWWGVQDQHDDNIMIDGAGRPWLVDIAI